MSKLINLPFFYFDDGDGSGGQPEAVEGDTFDILFGEDDPTFIDINTTGGKW